MNKSKVCRGIIEAKTVGKRRKMKEEEGRKKALGANKGRKEEKNRRRYRGKNRKQ